MNTVASSAPVLSKKAAAIIVDSWQLAREALRPMVESPALSVMGDGKTFDEALRHHASETIPDLIVYSLSLDAEVEHELASIADARMRFARVKMVVLADCVHTSTELKVMRLGVEALLSNDISVAVLQRALELVLLGQHLFPAELARSLTHPPPRIAEEERGLSVFSPGSIPVADHRRIASLSAREHQILHCLVAGSTNKAIARDLAISEATVKVHIKALLRKTRMANRTQAAIWALNSAFEKSASDDAHQLRRDMAGSQPTYPCLAHGTASVGPYRSNGHLPTEPVLVIEQLRCAEGGVKHPI